MKAKLCIECRHYDGLGRCSHPSIRSLVTGEKHQALATDMRGYAGECNKSGRLWAGLTESQRQARMEMHAERRAIWADECNRDGAPPMSEMGLSAWNGAENRLAPKDGPQAPIPGSVQVFAPPKRKWWRRVWG